MTLDPLTSALIRCVAVRRIDGRRAYRFAAEAPDGTPIDDLPIDEATWRRCRWGPLPREGDEFVVTVEGGRWAMRTTPGRRIGREGFRGMVKGEGTCDTHKI